MSGSLAPIIDSIYEAAFDQGQWLTVVKKIGEATGGFGGALVLWDESKRHLQATHNQGYPEEFWNAYVTRYAALDPRVHAFHARPELELYTEALLVSPEVKRKDDVINMARKKSDQRHAYGARLFSMKGFEASLFLGRTYKQDEAQQSDLDRLAVFLPHLRRSITLARKIGERLSTAALETMSFGVAIINDSGKVGYANKMMTRIAGERDGVGLTREGLVLDNADEDAAYRKLVARMRHNRLLYAVPTRLALPASRPSGKRPYGILICPLPRRDAVFPGFNDSLLVCVSDPTQTEHLTEEILAVLFGLSPAEGRLAINLIKFGSLNAAAAACGLTEGSARQYSKQIFAKTATQGQAELVALIMGSTRL